MTQGLVAGPSERTGRNLARIALVVIAFILTLALIIPYGSGDFVYAQSPPTGTQIEIVNPHPETTGDDPELSIKVDKDSLYHLVAWASNPPSGAIAEFALVSDDEEWTLGRTEESTDRRTFDIFSDLCEEGADPPPGPTNPGCPQDGSYTLRVVLGTSSGAFLDQDEMEVDLNTEDDNPAPIPGDPEDPAETVEIIYPEIAEELGHFIDPSGRANLVIEGVASAQTRFVRGFYTSSPGGSEPEWSQCGGYTGDQNAGKPSDAPPNSKFFRVKCVVTDGRTRRITGVALVTNDTPSPATASQAQPQFDDSTDAHTVADYYLQTVTEVQLDDPDQEGNAAGDCEEVTATIIDQRDRLMAGVSVDVHGRGPTDGLRFRDDSGSQAPDQASSGHQADAARNSTCANNDGTQGEHENPTGLDLKHIENTSSGTNQNGQFTFALWSATEGTTRYTAFADTDDDDRFCSSEQRASGTVVWDEPSANPTSAPTPDFTGTCPATQPSPPPGGTTTTTTTGTTSTTSGTTTTATTSGTTTTTTTTGQTTSPGPGTEVVGSNVTIRRNRPKFLGQVGSSRKRCERVRRVLVKKRRGRGKAKTVGRDVTNKRGNWKARKRRARGRFFAVVQRKVFTAPDGTQVVCRADRSRTIRVRRGR